MERYDLITPEGTKDLLFDECLSRRAVENKFAEIFQLRGYSEVVTTGIEFYDVFNKGSRTIPQEQLYKLVDSKGRLLAMRPDSTIPIARLVATRLKDAEMPLRLYYIQTTYENNALLKGHSDEIVQAGIELIGSDLRKADFEVLSTAMETLTAFEKDKFRLEIGTIGFFRELISKLDIDERNAEAIRYLILNKNYPALNDLLDEIGDSEAARALKQLPRLFGGEEVFERASKLFSDEKTEKILSDLKYVYNSLSKLGYEGKIIVDLGTVNRVDYYTGIVFRGYLEGIGEPVLSGGRYNKLISEFGFDVAATGFAINVNAVSSLLLKSGNIPKTKVADAIVFGESENALKAVAYSNALAKSGMTVENSLFGTFEETKEYAVKKGISKLYVVSDEVKEIDL